MKFLLATVLREGTVTFNPTINKEIDCEHVRVVGVGYMVPDVVGGMLSDYNYRIVQDPADAPAGSARVLRIQDMQTLDYYYIALSSGQNETTFATACNQCCDGNNDFTQANYVWPTLNLEEDGCLVGGNYTYFGIVATNPFNANVTLEGFSYNGGQPLPFSLTPGGYSSNAALVTALTTNASALGTWALVGNKIQLTSASVKSAYISPVVVDQVYCFTPPGTAFTAATLGTSNAAGTTISQPFPAIQISQANAAAVATELGKKLVGKVTIADYSGTKKITYTGKQKPINMANTGASTTVNFVAGVCS